MKIKILLAFCIFGLFNVSFISDLRAENNARVAQLDRYALNTPPGVTHSIQALSAYLTKPAKNDWEKARLIYRWITANISYNTVALFSGNYGVQNAESTLYERQAVCEGYAALFNSLAKKAGLESVVISGYAKGYGYSPGQRLTQTPNHSWNAVKINGTWRLIDSTWGAGHLGESGKFIRKYVEHFFLTPPDEFIYDHFPKDEKWQLLSHPLSKEEYLRKVRVYASFFSYRVRPKSHPDSIVEVNNKIDIVLTAPSDVLFMADATGKTKTNVRLVFVQREGGDVHVYGSFPTAGQYKLRVFAKNVNEKQRYNAIMEYLIIAKTGQAKAGYPLAYELFKTSNAHLYEPLAVYLERGSKTYFKVRVPGAQKVAVISGKKWFFLDKEGKDVFAGNVVVSKGIINVFAQFPGQRNFQGLLQYKGN